LKRSRLPLVLIGKNAEAIKAVGLLNDTTRDVCDKTANLYEAAGSYPPWMDMWFSKPTRQSARAHFARFRGAAKSRSRISLFQNLRVAALPQKWRVI